MVDRVAVYRAPTTVADVEAIADWLTAILDRPVEVRGRFLAAHADEATAEAFAAARVHSPHRRETGTSMLGAVRYERRVLEDPARGGGVLYDGHALQEVVRRRLDADERGLEVAHVVVLDRPVATWGAHDGRWHKRVSVLGQPALVSVPGLYEAPVKPESYYAAKHGAAMVAGDAPPREVLEAAVEGAFLLRDDPRTTAVLKGPILQAVHYLLTGDAFCPEPTCRLFNAHRQPELLRAQLGAPPFCERHATRYG
ncbi:MAG: DUF7001 family protein [Halobacteriales archaeon]